MYLGLSLFLLGWALYLSHFLALLLLPVFILYMSRFQIQAEEKVMLQKFADQYRAYLMKVRRWL